VSQENRLGQVWRAGRDRLRAAGQAEATTDAKRLAEAAFGLSPVALATGERDPVEPAARGVYEGLIARRLTGEPVARILGHAGFYGLKFGLSPETLVPRPETELLVDIALAYLGDRTARVLDLGTGSGCIPISILANAPGVTAVATDLSPGALAMARRNAERHRVTERLTLREGSWFETIEATDRFDAILSNPPYIETAALDGLMPEVRDHDPMLALDGGEDGLAPYRIIARDAQRWLVPGGMLAVEIGSTQGHTVSTLFDQHGFAQIVVHKDLAGLDRVVVGHHMSGTPE
jgi:release factor glutamine methyltransferase